MTATVFLALLASHLLGDWVVQSDEQALHLAILAMLAVALTV